MARPTRMIFINEAAGGTPIKLAFDAIGGPDFKLLAEGMDGTLVTYNQVLPEPAAVARFGLRGRQPTNFDRSLTTRRFALTCVAHQQATVARLTFALLQQGARHARGITSRALRPSWR